MGRGSSGPGQATVVAMGDGVCILREGSGQSCSGTPLSPVARAAAAVASNLVRLSACSACMPRATREVHASLAAAKKKLCPSMLLVRPPVCSLHVCCGQAAIVFSRAIP